MIIIGHARCSDKQKLKQLVCKFLFIVRFTLLVQQCDLRTLTRSMFAELC
jgi:hypothetical protein